MINKNPLSKRLFEISKYELEKHNIYFDYYKTNKGYFIYTIKPYKEE